MWVRLVKPDEDVRVPKKVPVFHIGYLPDRYRYSDEHHRVSMFIQLSKPDYTSQLGPLLVLETQPTIMFQHKDVYYVITGGPVPNIDTLVDDALHVQWDSDKDLIQQILFGRCGVQIYNVRTTRIKRPWN
jgi:hypothetical protein